MSPEGAADRAWLVATILMRGARAADVLVTEVGEVRPHFPETGSVEFTVVTQSGWRAKVTVQLV